MERTVPTSTVLSDAGYFAKRVTLSLALRSSGDAGRGVGRVGAAAALVSSKRCPPTSTSTRRIWSMDTRAVRSYNGIVVAEHPFMNLNNVFARLLAKGDK